MPPGIILGPSGALDFSDAKLRRRRALASASVAVAFKRRAPSEKRHAMHLAPREHDRAVLQTIARELALVKRALLWAQSKGAQIAIPHPWPTIKRDPPDPKRSGKYRDPEIVRKFLALLDQDARDEVVIVAMTGVRWAELKRLEYDWVEPAPKGWASPALIRLPESATKTRTTRVVGLPPPALAIIERRKADARKAAEDDGRPMSPLVFTSTDYRKQRETARHTMGLDSNITLRDMRHTFASLALQRTGDPTAVLKAMGHADLRMTERYLSSPLERTAALGAAVSVALLTEVANRT
jgi:integrase